MIFKKFFQDFTDINFRKIIEDLNTGLKSISFSDNFESQAIDISLTSGIETAIRHRLKTVPTGRLLVKQSGNATITDGITAWTADNIYLQNFGPTTVTVRVIIFK